MRTIRDATELRASPRPVSLAIGFFDGVHLGHQQVIRQTIEDALLHEGIPLVITFDRHPNTVVAPERVPPLIYSLPRRLRAIAALGVEQTLLIPFRHEFSQKTGEQFIRELVRDLGKVTSVCVGGSFVFGRNRSGNVDLLRKLGAELGFIVHGLAAVALDDKTVSSTRIRECIAEGNLDEAGQMLGRAYSLSGTVVPGDKLGRTLGFPTANLDTSGLVIPPAGVYAVHVQTPTALYRGVLNIGHRPTLRSSSPELRVETHLLDFEGDLYGQEFEVTPIRRLRSEQTFASLEELKAQIARDIAAARQVF